MKMHEDSHREMKEIEMSKMKLFQEYIDVSVKHHEELLNYLDFKGGQLPEEKRNISNKNG